jgi:hypothetical protein
MGSNTSDWPADQRRTVEEPIWGDGAISLLVSCPVDFGLLAKTYVKAMA